MFNTVHSKIWLSQESIIIIDYCAINRLLRERLIIAQSTDRCAIGWSVECAAQNSTAQSPDRANRSSAHNSCTKTLSSILEPAWLELETDQNVYRITSVCYIWWHIDADLEVFFTPASVITGRVELSWITHPEDNVEAEDEILDDNTDLRSLMSVPSHRFHHQWLLYQDTDELSGSIREKYNLNWWLL